jgi:hypothetical protein
VPNNILENFKYIAARVWHLVYNRILGAIMPECNKYPELIVYFRKKGYRVETDADLRDAHAWIPLELYVQLTTKACATFSERGRISKAVTEALEKWLKEGKDVQK